MKKTILKGERSTINFSQKIADTLKGGEIILLSGDLGAGKTTFTKGLGRALGVKQNINSPTFVIMKIYQANKETIKQLVHIDAYRLESGQDLQHIGATEYFQAKDTITVIEWPEKIQDILPEKVIKINIKNINENDREVQINR